MSSFISLNLKNFTSEMPSMSADCSMSIHPSVQKLHSQQAIHILIYSRVHFAAFHSMQLKQLFAKDFLAYLLKTWKPISFVISRVSCASLVPALCPLSLNRTIVVIICFNKKKIKIVMIMLKMEMLLSISKIVIQHSGHFEALANYDAAHGPKAETRKDSCVFLMCLLLSPPAG